MSETEFPGNAHKMKKTELKAETEETPEPDTKKVQKVVAGKVVRRKKSLGSRFKEVFIGGDAQTVGQYVLYEILIPAAKDMAVDMFSQGAERMFFGDDHHYGRRGGRPRGRASSSPRIYHNYQGYSSRDSRDRPPFGREEQGRYASRRMRGTHNLDDIILATRAEAEEVIDRLFDLVNRYEMATVADLYELLGLTSAYTDDKWGWTDLRGSDIRRVRDGYLLDLPRPEPLK